MGEVERLRAELAEAQETIEKLRGGGMRSVPCACCGAVVVRSVRLSAETAQCGRCSSLAEWAISGNCDLSSMSPSDVSFISRCLMTAAPQSPPRRES